MKIVIIATAVLLPAVSGWSDEAHVHRTKLPPPLRSNERTWRFPEPSKVRHGKESEAYLDNERTWRDPAYFQLRHLEGSLFYSDEDRMWHKPSEEALLMAHLKTMPLPLSNQDRTWRFPGPWQKPLVDNFFEFEVYSDYDRTWRAPHPWQILPDASHPRFHHKNLKGWMIEENKLVYPFDDKIRIKIDLPKLRRRQRLYQS